MTTTPTSTTPGIKTETPTNTKLGIKTEAPAKTKVATEAETPTEAVVGTETGTPRETAETVAVHEPVKQKDEDPTTEAPAGTVATESESSAPSAPKQIATPTTL
jgi:hypothetical protein